eukprot:2220449-Pleurochrysis_carterae.AAC.1
MSNSSYVDQGVDNVGLWLHSPDCAGGEICAGCASHAEISRINLLRIATGLSDSRVAKRRLRQTRNDAARASRFARDASHLYPPRGADPRHIYGKTLNLEVRLVKSLTACMS